MFNTPILFITFNRPENTSKVLEEIKKQRPVSLFVFSDGPREGSNEDINKINETRTLIENGIDWECKLHKMFLKNNLGCGKGPAEAIGWFFQNVPEGIIIEDDCVPHPDFFGYCSQLLEKYRFNEKIMVIGATTYTDNYQCEHSYTFTIYPTMAAWATWRRVWNNYDYYLSNYSKELIKNKLKNYFHSEFEYNNWMALYNWIVDDHFASYWDWQLNFILYINDGIAIRPKKNMIKNIGYGPDATHTNYLVSENFTANREIYSILPLIHPDKVEVDKKKDSLHYLKLHKSPWYKKVMRRINKLIHFYTVKFNRNN
jgi:hypothetical protein